MRRHVLVTCMAVALLALLPGVTLAQTIAGAVKDTSGAVMPGVTVEASSPALIEQSRTAVTDASGLYTIPNLAIGTYSVTFSLPGFSTVKRDGVVLTANFTATVSADMQVGAVEETVTVSGAAPTVDTHNVSTQKVLTREVLDAVPTATGFAGRAQLVPGMLYGSATSNTADVGGDHAENLGSVAIHGGHTTDFQPFIDGMSVTNGIAKHSFGYSPNNGMFEEAVLETGSQDAEHEEGGVISNLVPRDGSNTFRGTFYGNDVTKSMQANNLTQDLINQGLKAIPRVQHFWDINPSGGGPIAKDKLWFFGSFRYWGINQYAANAFYSSAPTSVFPNCNYANVPNCTPSGPQALTLDYHVSVPLKLTYQANQKNKFTFYAEHQYTEASSQSATTSPEASLPQHYNPQYLVEGTWTSPMTSHLLFQSAVGVAVNDPYRYHACAVDLQPGYPCTPYNLSSITELSTGIIYRANPSLSIGSGYGRYWSTNWTYKGSAAYVTGSHNIKVGVQAYHMTGDLQEYVNNNMNYQFRNGVPAALQEFTTGYATGIDYFESGYELAGFAQDQWVVKKFTINYGIRLDHAQFQADPSNQGAGTFAPARTYAAVTCVPCQNDLSPRLGVSYDVFGNGKTAIKGSIGRYLGAISTGTFAVEANPLSTTVLSVTRTWTDPSFPNDLVNGDVTPSCDVTNPLAQSGCPGGQSLGQVSDLNFGHTARVTTGLDSSTMQGFQNRLYNWEASGSVQHELFKGVQVNVGYFRRWYGNQQVLTNTALNASNYTPFCVTAPVDPRLPGGGGNQICGFYDENPDAFASIVNQNTISNVNTVGKVQEIYDGVDYTVTARLPHGIQVAGGFNTGRTKWNYCDVSNLPNVQNISTLSSGITFGPSQVFSSGGTPSRSSSFCVVDPPFLTQGKGFIVYPLPWWGIQTSATIQSIPGNPIFAGVVYTSAQIAPSLGRNLAAGANGTVVLDVLNQGQMYTPRLNQLDWRASKITKLSSRYSFTLNLDIYNVFNSNTVEAVNTRYGASWLTPTAILGGRMIKFGAQVSF